MRRARRISETNEPEYTGTLRLPQSVHKALKIEATRRDIQMQEAVLEAVREWLVPKNGTSTAQPPESATNPPAAGQVLQIDTPNLQTHTRKIGESVPQKWVGDILEAARTLSEDEIGRLRELVGLATRAIRVQSAGGQRMLKTIHTLLLEVAQEADEEGSGDLPGRADDPQVDAPRPHRKRPG